MAFVAFYTDQRTLLIIYWMLIGTENLPQKNQLPWSGIKSRFIQNILDGRTDLHKDKK